MKSVYNFEIAQMRERFFTIHSLYSQKKRKKGFIETQQVLALRTQPCISAII
jgi:hypothetical protein